MNRVIKFRAFIEGKMIYNPAITFWSEQPDDPIEVKGYSPKLDPEICILMQFTGSHDKNGKEIFEGDICKGKQSDYVKPFKIFFDSGMFGHWYKQGIRPITQLEVEQNEIIVIGNIYEHPELLK